MKSIICLVVLAFTAITVSGAVYGPEFRMKNVYNGPPIPLKQSLETLADKWIEQRIDNFDTNNLATYSMVSIFIILYYL